MGNQTKQFKGFDDWIHIFSVGKHTDSNGNVQFWSKKDLQSMADNHDDDHPAPLVIGHPKEDAPRYGDAAEYQLIDNELYFKGTPLVNEFEEMVLNKQFPERSIAVDHDGKGGYKIRHIGFLGAVPPALELQPMTYNHEVPPAFEFVSAFSNDSYTPTILARFGRRMRELIIENLGVEAADKVIPDYELESIADHANELRNKPEDEPTFNKQTTEGDIQMPQVKDENKKEFSQADIDAAVEAAEKKKTTEFNKSKDDLSKQLDDERRERLTGEFQKTVDKAIDDGCLLPAQAEGLAEFMASLPSADDSAIEFSRGEEGKKEDIKISPSSFFSKFIGSLGKQIDLGSESNVDDVVDGTDADAIAAAAITYRKEQADAGITISVAQAVAHVSGGNS